MKYVADDGTVFTTEQECLEYEKKVKDIEDSEDDSILDNPWHDSADHDINDTVPFKLTGTLPSNAQYYASYKMVFHDTLSDGLTFDAATVKKWLTVFYRRFFTQQFKRSCMPDGPKVVPVSLSPRADWRMPSDASAKLWLDECETL